MDYQKIDFICLIQKAKRTLKRKGGKFYSPQKHQLFSGWFVTYYNKKRPSKLVSIVDGEYHGPTYFFDVLQAKIQLEGVENYIKGKKDGDMISWHSNGKLNFEEKYLNGKLHGKCTKWSSQGALETIENYKDGKKHGLFQFYFQHYGKGKNFIQYEMNYQEGKKHGKFSIFCEKGKQSEESYYKDDKLDGIQTRWFYTKHKSTGILFKSGFSTTEYKNGIKHGYLNNFSNEGRVYKKALYKKGKLIDLWEEDEDECYN